MPVSHVTNIQPIITEIVAKNPLKIIELGIGMGFYGALMRNYLDGVSGRVRPDEWVRTIIGVEAYSPYNNPLWKMYDEVVSADFREYYQKIEGWDLVLVVDSLEHCEKLIALEMLDSLVKKNRRVIVSVPLGNCPQDECFGNMYEKHRSTWGSQNLKVPTEFEKYDHKMLHAGVCAVVSIKGQHGTNTKLLS